MTTFCVLCNDNVTCVDCQAGYYLFSATNCTACSLTLVGCVDCSDATNCTQCQNGYYQNGLTCATCTVANCASCPAAGLCSICLPDFSLINGNTACVCTVGTLVTGVCINMLGCVTAIKVGTVSTCIFCSNSDHFIL
jgi:hypothetical protein